MDRAQSPGAAFFEFLESHSDEYGYDKEAGTTEKMVSIYDLADAYPHIDRNRIITTNGGAWWRKSAPRFKDLVVEAVSGIRPHTGTTGTIGLRLNGKRRADAERAIRRDIVQQIKQRPCVVLGCIPSGKCAVDHKNGRYDDDSLSSTESQTLSHFQALHPVVNSAKREHCKQCRLHNKRFDARLLGYSIGWTRGDAQYKGSCLGCYWYDPKEFNSRVSKSIPDT